MAVHPEPDTDRALVFAHRGGSRLAPENTLAAFDRAVAEGVDGLELDVHLCADGEVVVCHDGRVERTTDGRGAICEMSLGQLSAVDAGFHFRDVEGRHAFRGQGVCIPALRDVLGRYPRHRLIIELKDDEARLADAVLGLVREAGAGERVCLGSFHCGVLERVRERAPEIATGASQPEVRAALYRSWLGLFPRHLPYQAFQVPERRESVRVVSPRFIRAAHRAGAAVQVWIVDRAEDIRRLVAWGVDGIISDRPDIAVATLRREVS